MDAKFQAAARRIMVGREESEEVILLAEEDFQLLMVFILPCKCKKGSKWDPNRHGRERETLEMVLLFSLLTEESVTRRRTDVMGKSRS